MVNVPFSGRVHVISAWIVAKENTQRRISDKIFFMIIEKKGRRPSEILVLPKGTAKHRTSRKGYDKPMP